MTYLDLNSIRSAMAITPEDLDFNSIQDANNQKQKVSFILI